MVTKTYQRHWDYDFTDEKCAPPPFPDRAASPDFRCKISLDKQNPSSYAFTIKKQYLITARMRGAKLH